MISHIPSGESDKEFVKKIVNELGETLPSEKIKNTFRVKRSKSPFTEMLNVEFTDEIQKVKLTERSVNEHFENLGSSHDYCKLQIWPDRSYSKRQDHRMLQNEIKVKNQALISEGNHSEIYVIRGGYRIVKVKKRPENTA